MASAVRLEARPSETYEIIDRLETNLSEEGRFASRTVALTSNALEVRDESGNTLHKVYLRDLDDTAVVETGGGAWLEARAGSNGARRIAFCTLSGLHAMKAFNDRIREQLAKLQGRQGALSMQAAADADDEELSGRLTWKGRIQIAKEIGRYAFPYRKQLILASLLLIVLTGLEAVPPLIMKNIIDGGVLSSSVAMFAGMVGLLVGVHALDAVLQVWRAYIGIRAGGSLVLRIRKDMFAKLMALPVRYYERRKTAPFIGRIQHDAEMMQYFLTSGVSQLLSQSIFSVAILVVMLTMDWRLTLVMVVLLALGTASIGLIWPKLLSLRNRKWNSEYDLQQFISEALQGVRVVKAFNRESRETQIFERLNENSIERLRAEQKWTQWLHAGMGLAVSIAVAATWYYGGIRVIDGSVSLGSVIAFTAYLSMFLGQLQSNMQAVSWTNSALAAADRIFDLLRTPAEPSEAGSTVAMPRTRGELRVEGVDFAYEQGREVLKAVSMHVKPGEKIGIVGRSGAGKSTLIHLCCRFYEPDAGAIRIDGIDIRRIARTDFYKHVGIVLQDTYLFDGTIAQNLLYGCPDATPEQMIAAARMANAHGFISRLPFGYDTVVGERGVQLSGGERQRISIARTLLHDPAILILDEATSSVDLETEKEIQEALERLSEGRTTIIIAHRLSTLQQADRIYVMDRGEIVDQGPHEQLCRREGIYRNLLRTQPPSVFAGEGSC